MKIFRVNLRPMMVSLQIVLMSAMIVNGLRCSQSQLGENITELPTVYEYFTRDGVTSGLEALEDGFRLNGKPLTILSGAIHYFRVHPAYWRDRLRKLRATGALAVETYVPWNLHEPRKDVYDFGDGDDDMSSFLNITVFLKTAREEDLLVIVRPGPYICAEWDFGGMPSWLLRNPDIKVRTSDPRFVDRMTKYFNKLFPILKDYQFQKGGPIIAFQIENEYGSVEEGGTVDKPYLALIGQHMSNHGLGELHFTSDNPFEHGAVGSTPGALMTANFKNNPEKELRALKTLQPNKPLWVMEYWSGWFDHWLEGTHNTMAPAEYQKVLEDILKFPASVNLYMFHGGTSFGFLNGANVIDVFPHYAPDVSSYDYDAPLSEAGDYTEKYTMTKELFTRYNSIKIQMPAMPAESFKAAYPAIQIKYQLTLSQLVLQVSPLDRVHLPQVVSMEMLDINAGNGQSFGFVLYRMSRLTIPANSVLKLEAPVRDIALVMVDDVRKTDQLKNVVQISGFGYWEKSNAELLLKEDSAGTNRQLDILVENWGRVNFANKLSVFHQPKGLTSGSVHLDQQVLRDWEIVALQFKRDWLNSLTGWDDILENTGTGPTLYSAILTVDEPHDTFINMKAWGKGNVFVNGFNIGRYLNVGPPVTLYIPGPLLNPGSNEILVFELFAPAKQLVFTDKPILNVDNISFKEK